jgi:hypothetical protein
MVADAMERARADGRRVTIREAVTLASDRVVHPSTTIPSTDDARVATAIDER